MRAPWRPVLQMARGKMRCCVGQPAARNGVLMVSILAAVAAAGMVLVLLVVLGVMMLGLLVRKRLA